MPWLPPLVWPGRRKQMTTWTAKPIEQFREAWSRLAGNRNVFPSQAFENADYVALVYDEPGKWQRWCLRRKDQTDIKLTWSETISLLRAVAGDLTLIEVYPRESSIVNTAPHRWFWVMPSHMECCDLR